jgi:hypothetical protein
VDDRLEQARLMYEQYSAAMPMPLLRLSGF